MAYTPVSIGDPTKSKEQYTLFNTGAPVTATQYGPYKSSNGNRGFFAVHNVISASGTGGVSLSVHMLNPRDAADAVAPGIPIFYMGASALKTAAGNYLFIMYPGLVGDAAFGVGYHKADPGGVVGVSGLVLPPIYRFVEPHGDATNYETEAHIFLLP